MSPYRWREIDFDRRAAVRRVVHWLVAGVLAAGSMPERVAAGEPAGARPEYRRRLDIPLLAAGAAGLVTGVALSPDRRLVPAAGLGPSEVRLALDRDVIGNRDVHADRASDYLRDASIAFPFVLSFASAPPGGRWRAPLDRGLLYVESVALTEAITAITESVVSRPRPFAYLSASDRPANAKYHVDTDRAFQSMPSGHATTAWCAASFGIVDHLLTRPDASWKEQACVGFAGGALATTTSVLRVEAGQHFPTDVIAGGVIGVAGGVTMPLLHRYVLSGQRAPSPSRARWLAAAAGMVAGAGATLLVQAAVGPP